MARKKGSKNKPKEKKDIDVIEAPESVEGQPPEAKPWKPEPVATVEVPKPKEDVCQSKITPYISCLHKREMHYGGLKGHCNTSGCNCQEFK